MQARSIRREPSSSSLSAEPQGAFQTTLRACLKFASALEPAFEAHGVHEHRGEQGHHRDEQRLKRAKRSRKVPDSSET